MLKEFVEAIAKLAVLAVEPKVMTMPGGKVLLLTGGVAEEYVADRKVHSDSLVSLASLVDWCHKSEVGGLVIGVSDTHISVSSNRDVPHLSDQASMRLQRSAAYTDLLDWCKNPRSTRQVVQGLRSKLSGTFDPAYLSIFKRLDFSRKNDGSKAVSHTGESMGRSVEMAAQSGAGEIPEMLLFSVYLFDGLPVDSQELRFAVTVDPAAETVSLAPVGDCIAEAFWRTRVELVERLKTEFPDAMVLETA